MKTAAWQAEDHPLTRKLVELQGGTIGVERRFGEGSGFSVVLPLKGAGAAQ